MEFSAKTTRIGQALLAAFVAVLCASLWLESRSTLAAAIRAREPWLCWLGFSSAAGDELYLAVYQPVPRTLDLVYFPQRKKSRATLRERADEEAQALGDLLPLAKDGGQGRFLLYAPKAWPGEPPLAAEDWLEDSAQGLRFWRSLARQAFPALRGDGAPYSFAKLLLAVELHRLNPGRLRSALLPESAEDTRAFLGRLFAPQARAGTVPVAVEVLNATGAAGVASSATDILRSQGVDVVNVGNYAGGTRARTVVYDRTGRVEDAEAVRDRLGCGDAPVVTQISPKKLVDATVVLGTDCPAPRRRGMTWNSLKF